MKDSYRSLLARVISLALIVVLALGAMTVVGVKVANAEVSSFIDSDGANDEPGQKDLTMMTRDRSSIDPVIITWNWDIISLSGSNTADGCALFDTDGDLLANFALCQSWYGAAQPSNGYPVLYSCNDSRADRCSGSVALSPAVGTTCTVAVTSTDPFPTGDSSPKDTTASCSIPMANFNGAGSADLLDVCSYPSAQPNSDPSDCVVISQDKGNLEVIKDVVPDDPSTSWGITVTGITPFADTLIGDDTTGNRAVVTGTYSTSETTLPGYTSAWMCENLAVTPPVVINGTGTATSLFSIARADIWKCKFTNTGHVDVKVEKTDFDYAAGQRDHNDVINYQLTVSYPSGITGTGANAMNVVVTDTLDANLMYVPGSLSLVDADGLSPVCTEPTVTAGGTLTCTVASMAPGKSFIVNYQATILHSAPVAGMIEKGVCDQATHIGTDGDTGYTGPVDICNAVTVTTASDDVDPTNNADSDPANIATPTAVTFLEFKGTPIKYGAILDWSTASEIHNVGFKIYRAGQRDGTKKLVRFVSSQEPLSVQGFSYSEKITGLQAQKVYFFWIADIDDEGNETLIGPVKVKTRGSITQ